MSRDYRKIIAWQRADMFACEVYAATADFPAEELQTGLGRELRAAAVAAAATIVEGAARRGQEPFLAALRDAQATLSRADYYLGLAGQLGYLDPEAGARLQELRGEASGLLYGFCAYIQRGGPREAVPIPTEIAAVEVEEEVDVNF